ncbi:sigma 54-interacting transcriptional regulator [Desulforamulus ruminis]|uniref:sigma 54-interacting transcriptional regulator n=1 Tax=Desulforamulus ruminis TaxID=1564 RepID=UPI0023537439|nr:sigma 54-interacting transcriptional regulator [Desulforamulus ruminis]
MISRLQQIQVTVQQIAEAISSVLMMDVTIFDQHMVRIAGTGYHRDTVGQRIIGYSVGHQVIEKREEYIIADIKSNDACLVCEKQSTCMELAQLCCPILLGSEVIGVISLIAFSREQQMEIIHKGTQLLDFIRKMAELIAAKTVEKSTVNRLLFLKNQLETVLNFVAEGVIAIDNAARVINMNFAAERMLRTKFNDVLDFHINEVFPGTPIPEILRNGKEFLDREVKMWRNGRQHHYLINAKPMLVDGVIQGAVASFRLVNEGYQSGYSKEAPVAFEDIVGNSKNLAAVKEEAKKAAFGLSTVLITGESGTGKEIFARAIHFASDRSTGPLVALNCAAIPEALLESELFGYEEGSFTGAKKGGKPGKFELANGGTLFLDEIGDMPLALQAKMLRVLQERVVERIGSVKVIPINVRMIAATNRNLEEMILEGRFREDLYYRLNVFPILLPALRERKSDIMELAGYFMQKHARAYGKDIQSISAEAEEVLLQYNWPGNIRELENAMECAVIKTLGSTVEVRDLPPKIAVTSQSGESLLQHSAEKEEILKALKKYGGSVEGKAQAAASLGISIATLYRKIRKYGLS